MEKVTKEMREELRKPLPQQALTQHGSKTFLTSIKPIFVIERLNNVFGIGSWTLTPKVIDKSQNSMVVVQVDFKIPAYGIELSCFGGNDNGGEGKKGFDLGDAYKGAVTDALTKIASWLEIGIDIFKGEQNHKTPAPNPKVTNINSKLPSWVNDKFSQCNTLNDLVDMEIKILDSKPDFRDLKEYKEIYTKHENRITDKKVEIQ